MMVMGRERERDGNGSQGDEQEKKKSKERIAMQSRERRGPGNTTSNTTSLLSNFMTFSYLRFTQNVAKICQGHFLKRPKYKVLWNKYYRTKFHALSIFQTPDINLIKLEYNTFQLRRRISYSSSPK